MSEMGKRFEFVKKSLGLTYREISEKTNIPHQSLGDITMGTRTGQYERIEYLAYYLDTHWQAKFKIEYPRYDGDPVEKITFLWLTLGEDDSYKRYKQMLKDIEDYYQLKHYELLEEIFALRERIKNSSPLKLVQEQTDE